MCKVYTEYHGTSEIEQDLCACTVNNLINLDFSYYKFVVKSVFSGKSGIYTVGTENLMSYRRHF